MMAEVIIQREAASTSATPEEENRFNEAVSLDHSSVMDHLTIDRRLYGHGLNLETRDLPVPPPQLNAASRPREDTPAESSQTECRLELVRSTKIGSSKRKNTRPKRLMRS